MVNKDVFPEAIYIHGVAYYFKEKFKIWYNKSKEIYRKINMDWLISHKFISFNVN